jgi:hypothetical protein
MALQWEATQSGRATSDVLRQQDYRIFIPQRVEIGFRSRDDTVKIVPHREIGSKTAEASSFDVISAGPGFTTVVEVKPPRAHLQKQESAAAFTLL